MKPTKGKARARRKLMASAVHYDTKGIVFHYSLWLECQCEVSDTHGILQPANAEASAEVPDSRQGNAGQRGCELAASHVANDAVEEAAQMGWGFAVEAATKVQAEEAAQSAVDGLSLEEISNET